MRLPTSSPPTDIHRAGLGPLSEATYQQPSYWQPQGRSRTTEWGFLPAALLLTPTGQVQDHWVRLPTSSPPTDTHRAGLGPLSEATYQQPSYWHPQSGSGTTQWGYLPAALLLTPTGQVWDHWVRLPTSSPPTDTHRAGLGPLSKATYQQPSYWHPQGRSRTTQWGYLPAALLLTTTGQVWDHSVRLPTSSPPTDTHRAGLGPLSEATYQQPSYWHPQGRSRTIEWGYLPEALLLTPTGQV